MSIESTELVKVSVEDNIAVVSIDHKPVNALNKATLEGLDQVVDAIAAEKEVKAAIITGAGSMAFVAGADIKEVSQLSSPEQALEMSAMGQRVFLKWQRLQKPVIAAINGVCLGGGLELAMACHFRVSGDRARFGQPEISLGIIPGWGGTQRLPRLIGRAKAIEWILSGEVYPAQEAQRLGLLNMVVPQDRVLKAAKDLARKITSKGAVAVGQALAAIEQGLDTTLENGMQIEADAFAKIAQTADAKEGITAFLEKRQPKFQDC